MLKFLALAATPGFVISQVSGGGWDTALAQLGAAIPFALLALWIIKEQRTDNKHMTEKMFEVIPALADSNRLLGENTEALERLAITMHQLAGRDPDKIAELLDALQGKRQRPQ